MIRLSYSASLVFLMFFIISCSESSNSTSPILSSSSSEIPAGQVVGSSSSEIPVGQVVGSSTEGVAGSDEHIASIFNFSGTLTSHMDEVSKIEILIWGDSLADTVVRPTTYDPLIGSYNGYIKILVLGDAYSVTVNVYDLDSILSGTISKDFISAQFEFLEVPIASIDAWNIKPVVAMPVLSISGGIVQENQMVEITTDTDSAAIYYTIDGSEPSLAATQYTAPLILIEDQVIRAKAFKRHWASSESVSSSFTVVTVFTDPRDDEVYTAVSIGEQLWMIDNLNYSGGTNGVKDFSVGYCYGGNDHADSDNCDLYGRLYDWSTVMNGDSSSNDTPSRVQGICPVEWHLPSEVEWAELINYVGLTTDTAGIGTRLKAETSWNTNLGENGNGSNDFAFSGTSGGVWLKSEGYAYLGQDGGWWSSTGEGNYARVRMLYNVVDYVGAEARIKTGRVSVRCIKNQYDN